VKSVYSVCLAVLLCTSATAPVAAQGFALEEANVRVRGAIGTTARVADQSSDIAQTELLTGPTLSALGRLRWRNDDGDELSLEAGLRTQAFPNNPEIDDLTASLFGEYRTDLESFENAQLRLRFGADRNSRFPEERFVRYTAQAALNLRSTGSPSSIYTLRYRYRDQNEDNSFDGFDQNEFFASARYAWSFRDQPLNQIAFTVSNSHCRETNSFLVVSWIAV